MKTKSMAPLGSLHPVLFFAGIYAVALAFSIFICSSLFYACNSSAVKAQNNKTAPLPVSKEQPGTLASR